MAFRMIAVLAAMVLLVACDASDSGISGTDPEAGDRSWGHGSTLVGGFGADESTEGQRQAVDRSGSVAAPSPYDMITSSTPPSAVSPPDWLLDREPLPSCGTFEVDEVRHDNVAFGQAVDCLMSAWRTGTPAELLFAMMTDEGDAVTNLYRILGEGGVEVMYDAREDVFGATAFGYLRCTELARGDLAVHAVRCEPSVERRVPRE